MSVRVAERGPDVLPDGLRGWVRREIGEVGRVREISRESAGSRLWEVMRGDRVRFFLKVAATAAFYTRETHAYRYAVPALGYARAPQLRASNPEHLALLVTAVPGRCADALPPSAADRVGMHLQAGRLLRQLHDTAGSFGAAGAAQEAAAEADLRARAFAMEEQLVRVRGLLSGEERLMAGRQAALLAHCPALPVAFVHGDVRESNFLWDKEGCRLAIVDYGRARVACAVGDLVRLSRGPWAARPRLRVAFLSGYGRELTADERRALPALAAADAVSALARGSRTADTQGLVRARATIDALMNGGHR